MKKSALIYCVALLSGVLLFSCKPNDQKLQKEIETVLSVSQSGVLTTVKGGVATLSGVVNTEEDKIAAEQAVKSVKDIKSVVNNIEVKAAAPVVEINPDDVLKTAVTTALTAGGFAGIAAEVKNGEVTLTGSVKRADLAKVMKIANEAKPMKVTNQLKID